MTVREIQSGRSGENCRAADLDHSEAGGMGIHLRQQHRYLSQAARSLDQHKPCGGSCLKGLK